MSSSVPRCNSSSNLTHGSSDIIEDDSELISVNFKSFPINAIRYDRVSLSKWTANNMLLYDLDSLNTSPSSVNGNYLLVDEVKLSEFLKERQISSNGKTMFQYSIL